MRVCQFRHIRTLDGDSIFSDREAGVKFFAARPAPATERMAASRSKQFRSGILILAISLICSWVIWPTLVLCGSGDPLAMLTARLISTGTGCVLVMKVKERSEKMVITTGMISPSWSLADVLALNPKTSAKDQEGL